MPKTDFLELEITTDNETKFEQWRNAINGPDNSNAKKIDAFAENINERVEDKLNKIWADITEQTTTNLTDILVFNRGSNVYKTTIANLLEHLAVVELFTVVAELPEAGLPNKIYLVPSSEPQTQNALDEYIWVDNAWEKIGAVSVDLSNYFNKTEINSMLGGKQDKLVAGENITIDENTNVISASGGGGVDLNMLGYMNYAADIYYRARRQSVFASAWSHSLTVAPLEISANSPSESPKGTAQYPNGETEGVIIPQGITSIGVSAFRDWALNNQPIVIPNSVTSIGRFAFYQWSANNRPLVIPDSVTYIGDYAFYDWTSNNQPLVIPNSVTSIESFAFAYWTSNNQPLIIPNSVTSIGDIAFADWSSNNQPLVIPNSVTSIGYGAFYQWSANNHPLIIPNSVTSIGISAFYKWTSNNQPLVIPNSVTSIGVSAFRDWALVPYIEMQSLTPPTLSNANAFGNQNNAPIYVPDESVEAYKSATNWVDLADRIFSINDK